MKLDMSVLLSTGNNMSTPTSGNTILLSDYNKAVAKTDKMPTEDLTPILLGLFGEVGSIMATSKKYHREKDAYVGYRNSVEEEFGDALWYLFAICRRLEISPDDLFEKVVGESYEKALAANDQSGSSLSTILIPKNIETLDVSLVLLGDAASNLLVLNKDCPDVREKLCKFINAYLQALQSAEIELSTIIKTNINKVCGRFLVPNIKLLPTFDEDYDEEEQLPWNFEIHITQRKSGKSYMRWNGVFIGAPLTDNIKDPDGYRFHDVFHFAHAAILHWSPTTRALIKQKRKSNPNIDETQDGGRAIVVEEGLTAWIFSYAKNLDYFNGQNSLSFDLLKTIQQFVKGYEVESCPLKLWEDTILQGYSVFRKVRDNNGGIVIGDRYQRTIKYRPLEGK